MNRPLTFALGAQLLLAFFSPAFSFGERSVFPADLWLFAWTGIFGFATLRALDRSGRRDFLVRLIAAAALFAAVFIHGRGRPSLTPEFSKYLLSPPDDAFSFGREAVIAARFYAWVVAGWIVWRNEVEERIVLRALAICVSVAALSLVVVAANGEARTAFGTFYGYDPNAIPWSERYYGVFRSPIEGCVCLCLSLMVLAANGNARRFSPLIGLGALGVALTKTITAPLSAAASIAFTRLRGIGPRGRVALAGLTLAAMAATIVLWTTPFLHAKWINLQFRVKPWTIYWHAAFASPGRFLLGQGFIPHFSDDLFVFLFSRGGLVLLSVATGYAVAIWKKYAALWSPDQRAIFVFLILSGLTVDSLVLRPVVYVLICAGIVALKPRRFPVPPT